MAREALSNAARHAQARRTRVVARVEDDDLVLRIEDDGLGFDPTAARSAGHLGLTNLRDRAAAFGGSIAIESTLGAGTTLSIRIPVNVGESSS
jgi:signal transduction histidine kinase